MIPVSAEGVTVAIDGVPIVTACDLRAEPGEIVGLIGPNGSGKSTLLRAVVRVLRPQSGLVTVGDDDVWRLSARRAAQRLAAVAQESTTGFDFTVGELVAMGRDPHKGLLERDTVDDRRIVEQALARVGMDGFASRDVATLSGGERQRVVIARAIAQQAQVLVLDEPTNHLDVHAQLDVLEIVRSLELTTIAALHDLNLAAAYCDRVYVVHEGRIVASGSPDDVLTPDLVARVFRVRADRAVHPRSGRLVIHLSPLHDRPSDEGSST